MLALLFVILLRCFMYRQHAAGFFLHCLIAAFLAFIQAAFAQTVRFPLAADNADDAARDFDLRARAVIQANACGNELWYATIIGQLADKNYDHQGEDLIHMLTAKAAWLKRETGRCEGKFSIEEPAPDNAGDSDLQAFQTKKLSDWLQPRSGSNCSASSSKVNSSIKTGPDHKKSFSIKITSLIERDCLKRQINDAVRLMTRDGRMGTTLPSPSPCPMLLSIGSGGEYDSALKEMVRLFYMSGAYAGNNDILEPDTVKYMWEHLLSARGPVGPDNFKAISNCADTAGESLGTPEDYGDRQNFLHDALSFAGDVGEFLVNVGAKILLFDGGVSLLEGIPFLPFYAADALGGTILLATAIDDPLATITAGPFDLTMPESENHRILEESSRFLINAAIIKALKRSGGGNNLDEIIEMQQGVREWLLKDLQRIAKNDFDEYNARPYTSYSLEGILNLYDFADDGGGDGDPAIRDAARIVLDLSEAKFAAGSNRGRRIAPYRRRTENDGAQNNPPGKPKPFPRDLYQIVEGSDHEVSKAIILSGQTQLLETLRDPSQPASRVGADIELGFSEQLVNASVSSYRLPRPIAEVAIERIFPFDQLVRHWGGGSTEIYHSESAFTMSVGGSPAEPALSAGVFSLKQGSDYGVAMPTNIIPAISGTLNNQIFQFWDVGVGADRRPNYCGWKGFICGVRPQFWNLAPLQQPVLGKCIESRPQADGSELIFVNSAFAAGSGPCTPPTSARLPGPHFFLAAKTVACDGSVCPKGEKFGIMEMEAVSDADAYSKAAFDRFIGDRTAALTAWNQNAIQIKGTYKNRAGQLIDFIIGDPINNGLSRILDVDGAAVYNSPFTSGDVIDTGPIPGELHIRNPWSGAHIDIDFTDWHNPRIADVPPPPGARTEIYKIQNTDNALYWYKHWQALAPSPAVNRVQGPKIVFANSGRPTTGDANKFLGWDHYRTVIAAIGSPVVYAMDENGDLFWYRHDGFKNGTSVWRGPKQVGNGWTVFDKLIAGQDGVIYGRKPDGTLRWYKHLGHDDGSKSWAQDRDVLAPSGGFGRFKDIFAGSNGVLYGILLNGDLIWNRHEGFADGTASWNLPNSRVGNGWQTMKAVLSVGQGIIYAISPEGNLIWFNHLGHATGENRSADSVVIGKGWADFKQVFAINSDN